MERPRPPQFLTDYSKESHPEQRQQAADAIRAKRSEYFEAKRERSNRDTAFEALQAQIHDLEKNGISRVRNFLKLRALRAELATHEPEQSDDVPSGMEQAKELLTRFYDHQAELWADADYSREDIERYFTEDHLASLNLEDYALLLRRFPGEMATHVTRQGIRDHALGAHHTGMGEYHQGFQDILKQGRLLSFLSGLAVTMGKEQALAHYLRENARLLLGPPGYEEKDLKEIATMRLDDMAIPGATAGSYNDRTAVHFGYQAVLNDFYGAERMNEIFFAFPMAHMTSEFHLMQRGGDTNDFHNDTWVWTKEKDGVNINAGIAFIPQTTPVDRNTGSRYQLDTDRRPMVSAKVATFVEVIKSPQFSAFMTQAIEHVNRDGNTQKLREDFKQHGITDPELQELVLGDSFWAFRDAHDSGALTRTPETVVRDLLERTGQYYEPATDTIIAKDYWEKYFEDHPEQRPSKIVYYDGTPSTALRYWLSDQGIDRYKDQPTARDIFPDKYLAGNEREALYGLEEFKSLGKEVIEKYI